jgi:hypothetical protein
VAAAAEVEAVDMLLMLRAGQDTQADTTAKMCNEQNTASRASKSPWIYLGDVTGTVGTAVSPIPEVEVFGKSVQKFSTLLLTRQFSTI